MSQNIAGVITHFQLHMPAFIGESKHKESLWNSLSYMPKLNSKIPKTIKYNPTKQQKQKYFYIPKSIKFYTE